MSATPLHEALLSAIEQMPMPIALFDEQDMLCYANAAYDAIFLHGLALPVSFADLMRHAHRNGFGVRIDCGDIEVFLADTLSRRRKLQQRLFNTDLLDGRWVQFTETELPGGWMLTIASDVTALKRSEQTMRHAHADAMQAALTDSLTGASNRRHILSLAEQMLLPDARLTVALLDLDHFKHINDGHGHHVGDAVLQHFCREALRHLRVGDRWGRYGGEEFLLLLPSADAQEGAGIVARLHAMPSPADLPRYTFSAGVAQAGPGESLQRLLRRADEALYEAKASGRNRTVISCASQR